MINKYTMNAIRHVNRPRLYYEGCSTHKQEGAAPVCTDIVLLVVPQARTVKGQPGLLDLPRQDPHLLTHEEQQQIRLS